MKNGLISNEFHLDAVIARYGYEGAGWLLGVKVQFNAIGWRLAKTQDNIRIIAHHLRIQWKEARNFLDALTEIGILGDDGYSYFWPEFEHRRKIYAANVRKRQQNPVKREFAEGTGTFTNSIVREELQDNKIPDNSPKNGNTTIINITEGGSHSPTGETTKDSNIPTNTDTTIITCGQCHVDLQWLINLINECLPSIRDGEEALAQARLFAYYSEDKHFKTQEQVERGVRGWWAVRWMDYKKVKQYYRKNHPDRNISGNKTSQDEQFDPEQFKRNLREKESQQQQESNSN